jgi:formylglycine-generating enzyme required for sulfatase activity/tRNA A-37 threonylcarbamoyl transferase component Bud32
MSSEEDADSSAIDRAADRFERAWKSGHVPRIEEYLLGTSGDERCRLFEELLIVERELLSRLGELPDVDGYRHRFPDLVEIIDRNFAQRDGTCATELYTEEESTTVGEDLPRRTTEGSTPGPFALDPRFRVLRHHADGGVGRVSLALDLELRRKVALKELKDQFADDPQFRERFLMEVEITGRLEHPGVIPVYSLGRDERGRPFYAMRFIKGEDLEQAIRNFHAADNTSDRDLGSRALALRQLLRRFVDVCNVVSYAHSRGVLHRDLKPGNILLGPYGETLVVDWGMAKPVCDQSAAPVSSEESGVTDGAAPWNATQHGFILGTIPYMSPEQAEGGPLGTRSDVYSLGATLYHIVTGRPPIAKGDRYAMLSAARRGDITPPRTVNHRVPAGLDAICRKAMSANPEDRYASPRALADDIEHWLADEPVSAWREPTAVRARRWVARHRTGVAAAGAALSVAAVTFGHLLHDYHVKIAERRAAADGLLVALKAADVSEVSGIVRQLEPLRPLVLGRLKTMAQGGAAETETATVSARRNAALALLGDDPAQAEYLIERILRESARPREIKVVRLALFDHGRAGILEPRLWRLLRDRRAPAALNLGAAGVLAQFCAHDLRWGELAQPIAEALVQKGPLTIGEWREVFQPIDRALLGPLRAIMGDVSRSSQARALAATLLRDFAEQPGNSDRDRDLAELIGDTSPEEFPDILRALGDPRNAVKVLLPKLDQPGPFDETSARRRGRIAATLIVLGAPDRAWPMLARGPTHDVNVRSELIHDFAVYGVDPALLVKRIAAENDTAARRALVLGLGYYSRAAVPSQVRGPLLDQLGALYAHDSDAGLHSAIEWLLRTRWGLGQMLDRIERSPATRAVATGRNWFVNADGVTMSVIHAVKPLVFDVGSPEDEDGRDSDERMHAARLDRSFAIATREVTVREFARYLESDPDARRFILLKPPAASAESPKVGVDWFAAAAYCNWLSRRERLDPYYVIRGPVLSIPHPEGLGYRLPSEHEWEYACRALSRTSRPYGASEALLEKYAWFVANAAKHAHPVGLKEPNDFGLFDMLGNAFEWTEDRYIRDRDGAAEALAHKGAKFEAQAREIEVVLRGGSFNSPATSLRSAYRERSSPSEPLETYGFRYVRTLPP